MRSASEVGHLSTVARFCRYLEPITTNQQTYVGEHSLGVRMQSKSIGNKHFRRSISFGVMRDNREHPLELGLIKDIHKQFLVD